MLTNLIQIMFGLWKYKSTQRTFSIQSGQVFHVAHSPIIFWIIFSALMSSGWCSGFWRHLRWKEAMLMIKLRHIKSWWYALSLLFFIFFLLKMKEALKTNLFAINVIGRAWLEQRVVKTLLGTRGIWSSLIFHKKNKYSLDYRDEQQFLLSVWSRTTYLSCCTFGFRHYGFTGGFSLLIG